MKTATDLVQKEAKKQELTEALKAFIEEELPQLYEENSDTLNQVATMLRDLQPYLNKLNQIADLERDVLLKMKLRLDGAR